MLRVLEYWECWSLQRRGPVPAAAAAVATGHRFPPLPQAGRVGARAIAVCICTSEAKAAPDPRESGLAALLRAHWGYLWRGHKPGSEPWGARGQLAQAARANKGAWRNEEAEGTSSLRAGVGVAPASRLLAPCLQDSQNLRNARYEAPCFSVSRAQDVWRAKNVHRARTVGCPPAGSRCLRRWARRAWQCDPSRASQPPLVPRPETFTLYFAAPVFSKQGCQAGSVSWPQRDVPT